MHTTLQSEITFEVPLYVLHLYSIKDLDMFNQYSNCFLIITKLTCQEPTYRPMKIAKRSDSLDNEGFFFVIQLIIIANSLKLIIIMTCNNYTLTK